MRRKIKDFPVYKVNPFPVGDLEERVRKAGVKEIDLVSREDGEALLLMEKVDARKYLHDKARYIKMFGGGVVLLKNIGSRGKDLLCYVLEHLRAAQNEIVIRREDVVRDYGELAGDSFYVGLSELLDYGFLARSDQKHTFYINRNCFYNGDRRKTLK